MPARTLPTTFKVQRPIKLAGTAYVPGATVAASVVVSALGKRLSAYVSRGYLFPTPPQYPRTARRATQVRPSAEGFYLSPKELRSIS